MSSRADRGCLAISSGDAAVRPLKTSETVARDIVHDIVARRLDTGDSLPHEAAMLEQYGVSRESLREGLRLLEVQGLITIRRGPGGGPTVGRVDPANLGRISSLYYHLAGASYGELFDAWVLAETQLAELAARSRDRQAVAKAMEPFQGEPVRVADGDVVEVAQVQAGFHHVVAALAGNRVLELMLQTVGSIVTHHFVVTSDPRRTQDVVAADHVAIAGAIAAGHANKARQLMEDHIHRLAEFCRAEIGDQVDDFIEWR